jgi:hypothetical protein
MLLDGAAIARGTSVCGFSASASRCATYNSTTPSTPRPKSMAAAPVAAADNLAPVNPIAPRTMTSDSPVGTEPIATSQRLRNTTNSRGRMTTSEPRVFRMLSRLTTASVSTAMRCPPANSTRTGGRGSSSSLAGARAAARADTSSSRRRASSARENSLSYGGRFGRAITSRL